MAGYDARDAASSFWRPGVARYCLPAAAAFFGVLITVGNLPGLAAQMSDTFGDKRLHLAAYAFLTLLIYCLLYTSPSPRDS